MLESSTPPKKNLEDYIADTTKQEVLASTNNELHIIEE